MSYSTCPICGNELAVQTYSDDYRTVERYIECNTCNYYYEDTYGHSRLSFGNNEFYWSYSITNNKRKILFKKIKRYEFMSRRNWHKGLKRKYYLQKGCS